MLNRGSGGIGNAVFSIFTRHFSTNSRSRAENLRKINPRVSFQEAAIIAEDLYGVIKTNGPLTISNAWNQVKEAGVDGLSSKTHMKLMLKWMRGRSMLKQICNGTGSNKKFLLITLPEDPNQVSAAVEPEVKSGKPARSKKKLAKEKKKQSRL